MYYGDESLQLYQPRSYRHIPERMVQKFDLQKFSLSANWISRGLLLAEIVRPKLPALMTWPVTALILPPVPTTALKLLMGLARFT